MHRTRRTPRILKLISPGATDGPAPRSAPRSLPQCARGAAAAAARPSGGTATAHPSQPRLVHRALCKKALVSDTEVSPLSK